ncbi:MAG: putative sugar nucleotidyl transferase [Candidatus Caldarchaeum sp.]|nr:putative sugar nucleotidyl transferase [Candidatus Caldarchaeum sp.]
MIVCVFEDQTVENLWPLTATRPVFDIFLGTSTLLEKITSNLSEIGKVALFTRPYLQKTVSEKHVGFAVNLFIEDDEVLLINGRAVVNKEAAQMIQGLGRGIVLKSGESVVAVRTKSSRISEKVLQSLSGKMSSLELLSLGEKVVEARVPIISFPWDIIQLNASLLREEARGEPLESHVRGLVYRVGECEIEENVVLDGRKGPVMLGKGVVVESFSRISGPCFVGDGTRVFSGSSISGSSIGPVCRVGGEVEESVFFGFSNKRHYGYVGHSVVGEWVNMGAGTTVSNLKNTYGTIKVNVGGKRIDTKRQFLGCFIADHAKTGIGCMISGGVKVGVSSHVYQEVVEDVPSFTIYSPKKKVELILESALNTACRMMERREIRPSQSYLEMLAKIFEMTKGERESAEVKPGKFSFYNGRISSSHG